MSRPNNTTMKPETSIDATTSAMEELEVDDELPTPEFPTKDTTDTTMISEASIDATMFDMEELEEGDELPTKWMRNFTLEHLFETEPFTELPGWLISKRRWAFNPPEFALGFALRNGTVLNQLARKCKPGLVLRDSNPQDWMAAIVSYVYEECKMDSLKFMCAPIHSKEGRMVFYVTTSWETKFDDVEENISKVTDALELINWKVLEFKWYLLNSYDRNCTDFNLPPFNREMDTLV